MSNLTDIEQQLRHLSKEARADLLEWLFDSIDADVSPNLVAEAHPRYADREPRLMTVEEYLLFEENAALRHEYINGAVYAMSGAALVHNRITFQFATALSSRLGNGPCKVFLSDVKLRLELGPDTIFYYPDVIVDCRPEEWGANFVRNPKLVVEVLSPSTQHIDRREKSLNYHRAAIEEYIILSQTERRAVLHRYGERWDLEVASGPGAVLQLRSLGFSIPLEEIYGDALA
ncbi:MAG: Uma2 family endonuclease [Steroidobacteraceae bacterium]